MKTKPIEFKMQLSSKKISSLFINACEGGSNYWCSKVLPLGKQKDSYEAMIDGFYLVDKQRLDDTPITVTREMIEKAVGLMAEKHSGHFHAFISENDDAETGDVFLQLCAFGKVIYG